MVFDGPEMFSKEIAEKRAAVTIDFVCKDAKLRRKLSKLACAR